MDRLTLTPLATCQHLFHRAVVHIVVVVSEHAILNTPAFLVIVESASDRNLV
jgi:hypothetical protein